VSWFVHKTWSCASARPGAFICKVTTLDRSRDSVVDIATGYGLDDRWVGVRVPVGSTIISSLNRPYRLWVPTSYPMGTGGSFPGGKAAEA
jgi:hypothetical protein